jgi:hypothetical protein
MVGRLVLETLPAVADDPEDVAGVMAVVNKLASDPGECCLLLPTSLPRLSLFIVSSPFYSHIPSCSYSCSDLIFLIFSTFTYHFIIYFHISVPISLRLHSTHCFKYWSFRHSLFPFCE